MNRVKTTFLAFLGDFDNSNSDAIIKEKFQFNPHLKLRDSD